MPVSVGTTLCPYCDKWVGYSSDGAIFHHDCAGHDWVVENEVDIPAMSAEDREAAKRIASARLDLDRARRMNGPLGTEEWARMMCVGAEVFRETPSIMVRIPAEKPPVSEETRRREDAELQAVRREVTRRCVEQARLGRNNNELRLMGFADAAINDARRYVEAENKPYNENNPPVAGRKENDQ